MTYFWPTSTKTSFSSKINQNQFFFSRSKPRLFSVKSDENLFFLVNTQLFRSKLTKTTILAEINQTHLFLVKIVFQAKSTKTTFSGQIRPKRLFLVRNYFPAQIDQDQFFSVKIDQNQHFGSKTSLFSHKRQKHVFRSKLTKTSFFLSKTSFFQSKSTKTTFCGPKPVFPAKTDQNQSFFLDAKSSSLGAFCF